MQQTERERWPHEAAKETGTRPHEADFCEEEEARTNCLLEELAPTTPPIVGGTEGTKHIEYVVILGEMARVEALASRLFDMIARMAAGMQGGKPDVEKTAARNKAANGDGAETGETQVGEAPGDIDAESVERVMGRAGACENGTPGVEKPAGRKKEAEKDEIKPVNTSAGWKLGKGE